MGILWPPGWTRLRRGALCVVDGLALWFTALLIHIYQHPAEWNVARSAPASLLTRAASTTLEWTARPTGTPSEVTAYLGGALLVVGVGWYWLLRPLVVRYTDVLAPIADPE